MGKNTDYKKMWKKERADNVSLMVHFNEMQRTTNRVIEIHNKQGKLLQDLLDDKMTLDEFKTQVKAEQNKKVEAIVNDDIAGAVNETKIEPVKDENLHD